MALREEGAAKRPRLQLPALPTHNATLQPPSPRPKLTRLHSSPDARQSETEGRSPGAVPSPCSQRLESERLGSERQQSQRKPFHVLLAPLVGWKLAGCLSSAVLVQGSQELLARAKPSGVSGSRTFLQFPYLSHRLSLRLLSRSFGNVLHASRIHTLKISKHCHSGMDNCKRWEKTGLGWREVLPSVRSLFLDRLSTVSMAELLRTETPYPSLRRLRLDGGRLFREPCDVGPLSYPSLAALKWKGSDSAAKEISTVSVSFLAKLLGALPAPDALRHLVLKGLEDEDMVESTMAPLLKAIKCFSHLRSFAGFRTKLDHFALLKASAETLTTLDAVECSPSGRSEAFTKLRRLSLWDRHGHGLPDLSSASVQQLFLRVEFNPETIMRVVHGFRHLRVLNLFVFAEAWEEAGGDEVGFYKALESVPSLRVLLLTLDLEVNDVRLSRLPLETLGLAATAWRRATMKLRLGGETERSLTKLIIGERVEKVLWGEDKVPVADTAPVASGRLQLIHKTFFDHPFG